MMTFAEAFERAKFATAVTGAVCHVTHTEGPRGYDFTIDEDHEREDGARTVVTFRPSPERELHDLQTAQVRSTQQP